MLNEFIEYLNKQVNNPYIWGAQHTLVTPDNYISVLKRREGDTGGYKGGPTFFDAAKSFCEKRFADGSLELYAYDCSGLGVYWLYNLMHLYTHDHNANMMMNKCDLRSEVPKRGWWVFKCSGNKATHIGYMVTDTTLIEAKGRKDGVVVTKFNKRDWNKWGIPKIFKDEIKAAAPDEPQKPADGFVKAIRVKGSVRVREGNGKKFDLIPPTACNCLLEFVGQAREEPYWYETHWSRQHAFISSNPKYTELIDVACDTTFDAGFKL